MKIGIVRSHLGSAGGAERYALGLISTLAEQNHEVHVFTASLPPEHSDRVHPHLFRPRWKRPKPPRAWRTLAFERWLKEETAKQTLDILFTMERTWPSDIFRAGDGVHKEWLDIVRREGKSFAKFAMPLQPFHRRLLRAESQLFRPENTRLVVCNSRMVSEEIVRHYQYPRERLHVVPNGVNTEYFRPAVPEVRQKLRAGWKMNEDDIIALFVGSGFWRKGLDIAIEIIAQWQRQQPQRKIHFFVVGKGSTKEYSEQAKKLGVAQNIHFMGAKAPHEVLEWYQGADLFVFPTRYDPFANVCLEANACGVPVVTTSTNGFHEQIQANVNGIVLEQKESAQTQADAVEELFRNRPDAATVRQSIAHLTLENHVDSLLKVLEECVAMPK